MLLRKFGGCFELVFRSLGVFWMCLRRFYGFLKRFLMSVNGGL